MDTMKHYRQFLRDWLKWAEAGGKSGEGFDRVVALCANASIHDNRNKVGGKYSAWVQLNRRLRTDLGNNPWPFNDSFEAYNAEGDKRERHKNPRRLEWVKKELARLDELAKNLAEL